MILLQCQNLKKSYGVNLVFQDVSFLIETGDRLALVGSNGAGKSTLLKCLVGEEAPDEGTITFARNLSYGYLTQLMDTGELELSAFELALEAFQELIVLRKQLRDTEKKMSKPEIYNSPAKLADAMKMYGNLTARYEMEGGYTYEARIKEILTGLGFREEEWERPVATFSGGQKTRLGLARLLAREPELLILDEPTNYLDLQSLGWLENYLKQYKGAMLVVSHDRYFLDAIATKVMDLEERQLKKYSGNYSQYAVKRARAETAEKKAYVLQEARVQRLTAYVEKYRAGIKSKQARGREKQLQKIIALKKPQDKALAKMKFTQGVGSGYQILTVNNLSFGYNEEKLFGNLNFEICQGDRVALIGDNGTGKTTLLKLILNEITSDTGKINFGSRVKLAYFAQEGETLGPDNSVLEEILSEQNLTIEETKGYLARFLFRNDELEKRVKDLSGGEKSRLALAKLMLTETNFLILDEPTNHLDAETRQVLEDTLQDFEGAILMVSHDRYFINQVANQIWELKKRQIEVFLGDYDYYLWKKEETKLQKESEKYLKGNKVPTQKTKKVKIKTEKRPTAAEIEKEIMIKEGRLEELVNLLGGQELYKDAEQLITVQREYNMLEKEIETLYEDWSIIVEEGGK